MKFSFCIVVLLSPFFLFAQGGQLENKGQLGNKKILMVVSSYGKSEGKIRPGYEFDEFSQAWLIFKANGFQVDVASPRGGNAEPDEFNSTKPYNKMVTEDAKAMGLLRQTKRTSEVETEEYAAIYIVGGKGAMFDLPFDPSLQDIIRDLYEKQNGLVAAVCHGPAALVNVRLQDGSFLVSGKKMTGFSNDEERKFGKTWVAEFPFLLEDKLKSRGSVYENGESMLPFIVKDERILTGQNPYSTTQLAEEVVKALGKKPVERELYKDERSMIFVKRALNGDTTWAKGEIKVNTHLYDPELIAVYGYYKLIKSSSDAVEIKNALQIIELVKFWVFNEHLQLEMAKGYLHLKNKDRARKLLVEVLDKHPSFEEAKKLLEEIK
jgi:putative intracellular protease/amidase